MCVELEHVQRARGSARTLGLLRTPPSSCDGLCAAVKPSVLGLPAGQDCVSSVVSYLVPRKIGHPVKSSYKNPRLTYQACHKTN